MGRPLNAAPLTAVDTIDRAVVVLRGHSERSVAESLRTANALVRELAAAIRQARTNPKNEAAQARLDLALRQVAP